MSLFLRARVIRVRVSNSVFRSTTASSWRVRPSAFGAEGVKASILKSERSGMFGPRFGFYRRVIREAIYPVELTCQAGRERSEQAGRILRPGLFCMPAATLKV